MSFFRRIISIFGIAALLVSAVYGFLYLKSSSMSKLNPSDAIPSNFLLCLKTSDLVSLEENFRNKNEMWAEFKSLKSYKDFNNLNTFLDDFDSLRNNNTDFEATGDAVVVASGGVNGSINRVKENWPKTWARQTKRKSPCCWPGK